MAPAECGLPKKRHKSSYSRVEPEPHYRVVSLDGLELDEDGFRRLHEKGFAVDFPAMHENTVGAKGKNSNKPAFFFCAKGKAVQQLASCSTCYQWACGLCFGSSLSQ